MCDRHMLHVFRVVLPGHSSRRSGPERVEGGGETVQLHAAQLLRVSPRRAAANRHHLLAQLPPGQAVRWELRVLLVWLQRLPVRAHQGHQEIS